MKNLYRLHKKLIYFLCVICLPYVANAQSLRQFTNKDGLSNSAILSLYQDRRGVIWIGSCDGLNVFDGTSIQLYSPVNASKTLSGNLINRIVGSEQDVLWIQTNYGLDRLDTGQQTCRSFAEFKDKSFLVQHTGNDLFILKDDGCLYYYLSDEQSFRKLDVPPLAFEHVLAITIDKNNHLWVFTSNGDTRSYRIDKTEQSVNLVPVTLFKHPGKLLRAFAEDNLVYFIDETYSLYEYDFNNRQSYYIADLKAEIDVHGGVSSITKMHDDYYIGFKSSGLTVLKYMADQKVKYQLQRTEIHSGVFCLMKDKFQDILWIGTDGQGVYMYYNDAYTLTSTLLDTPVYQISNPVRALYFDEEQTLWVGTKGGGILRIKDYDPSVTHPRSFDRISTSNSTLTDNSVYCFAPGCLDKLWIGTEYGINYYSYRSRQTKVLPVTTDGKQVKYVHSIYELNDTTLWVSTVGEGIVKVTLGYANALPVVKSAKRIVLDGGRMASNYFFTSFRENDSILWFGNRGQGAYRLNVITEELIPYNFSDHANSQTVNDIFSILKNDQGFWLGTSSGLLHFNLDNSRRRGDVDLYLNNTVHGILEDRRSNLWMSTNQGLVRFNPQGNTGQTYNRGNGLTVTEFSDGAFYKDEHTGTLFFGGTNGFVTVGPNAYIAADYLPQIHLKGLSIFGKNYNIYDFLSQEKDRLVLQLDYSQNFFCIDFMTLDFINGNNYSYSYKLEEISNNWVENGSSASAIFSNLAPGEYTLLVKYRNNINGEEGPANVLLIRITPPWYLNNWAYAVYVVLALACSLWIVLLCVRKYRRKQQGLMEKLNRQKKEEIYESKLRFFTNITHEFCTPLTLIYGPCEKILAYPQADGYIRRYVEMIRQNAERLNSLILELLEFRRLETGHRALAVRELSVSEEMQDMAESFCELAESRKLEYRLDIEPGVQWNTDLGCFNKIAGNLLSNAFKYTPDGGNITVELKVENQLLTLRVSNSGKGIDKENLTKVFDRFKILDSFEVNSKNSRNGLGLAICKSMATLLNGQIDVGSVPGEQTTFTVTLPQLPLTTEEVPQEVYGASLQRSSAELPGPERIHHTFDASRQTIMIIDDEPSMLWFISEIFVGKYNVLSFSNAGEALASLELKQPDLIISDVMMPETDGLSFARTIKQNKLWTHIPLILLSALHHEDEQVKGIDSGAEAYVTKPFNVRYLERIVHRLIQRKSDLKEYYSSIHSSFKVDNGNVLHQEDQEFLDKIMETIEKNVSNPNLSIELLSRDMGYSARQLYRKLKPITDKSPTEIIKEYRLAMAERLLLTKNLTIEDIMGQTGFANRGTFYKLFTQHYGIPPRQYREQQEDIVRKDLNH